MWLRSKKTLDLWAEPDMWQTMHAMAFVARALLPKWKQPLGHFLSSGPMTGRNMKLCSLNVLKNWLLWALPVKVVIGDQGSNHQYLFETLFGASCEKPYFVAHETKVFVLYDPLYLMKTVSNNLKKSLVWVWVGICSLAVHQRILWGRLKTVNRMARKLT